ncbi:MAG: hypothetical protein PHD05_00450 [Sphaerochaetaceae bacterium]|nr:hypothetical protein [Sphaerochaetaceae bacterium]
MKLSEFINEVIGAANYLEVSAKDIDIEIGGYSEFQSILSVYPTHRVNPCIIIEPGDKIPLFHTEYCPDCGENLEEHYKNGANGCPCCLHMSKNKSKEK